jgi:hypothetical protein
MSARRAIRGIQKLMTIFNFSNLPNLFFKFAISHSIFSIFPFNSANSLPFVVVLGNYLSVAPSDTDSWPLSATGSNGFKLTDFADLSNAASFVPIDQYNLLFLIKFSYYHPCAGISFPARSRRYEIHIYRHCPSWYSSEITSKLVTTSPLASWSSPGRHSVPYRLHAGKSSWKNVDRTEPYPLYATPRPWLRPRSVCSGMVTVLRLL